MRAEKHCPPEDRILWIDGRLSDPIVKLVKGGLPSNADLKQLYFLGYSYADLPIGKTFDVIFDANNVRDYSKMTICIKAVTQQNGKHFDEIPHGWKTICWVLFQPENDRLLNRMPILDAWTLKSFFGICSNETYSQFLKTVV